MTLVSGLTMYSDVQSNSFSELVENYAPLVKRIAHHIMLRMPASVQLEDLMQSGMIGLLEAARNYDAGKGASFETYAGIRIRGAMIDEVRKGDWAPRSVHRNARRVAAAIKEVEARTGHDASDQEVAQQLGIEIAEYYGMLQDSAGSRLFSFDDLGTTEDGSGCERIAGDFPTPLDELQKSSLRENLAKSISQLPERERLVLALYYDEELNLKEIGSVLGVSESRVSQIHSQAALRLRSRLGDWKSQ